MKATTKAERIFVSESDLYEVYGEDEPIVTFNTALIAEVDGVDYCHNTIIPGHFVDADGINRMRRSRAEAYKLLDRIEAAGNMIDLNHWTRISVEGGC